MRVDLVYQGGMPQSAPRPCRPAALPLTLTAAERDRVLLVIAGLRAEMATKPQHSKLFATPLTRFERWLADSGTPLGDP